MTRYGQYGRSLLAGLILATHPWATAPGSDPRPVLAVVVHKSSPVDDLYSANLRKMLTGELRAWPDASRVVVIEQPEDSATQQRSLRVVLKNTPSIYKRQLLETQFQGREMPAIRVLNSDETAIKFVWNVPGAFAIVDGAAAASAGARVKILKIDGKLPDEQGYSLR
jgi:ABC-type phosphate transport system substrate-binding protein